MKKALIHDWFSVYAGAEKCVGSFTNIWDDFDVYSLIDFLDDRDREIILKGKKAKTSFIQNLPKVKIQHTKVFIFTDEEDFGIMPIKAQACGCPVVCSNAASFPEVCGDSVLYCDPYSVKDIAEKIKMVLDDENLQNKLKAKGFENIKRFSWEESAKKIIEIIERIY